MHLEPYLRLFLLHCWISFLNLTEEIGFKYPFAAMPWRRISEVPSCRSTFFSRSRPFYNPTNSLRLIVERIPHAGGGGKRVNIRKRICETLEELGRRHTSIFIPPK